MGQISQFLRSVNGGIGHYCPACRELHCFSIDEPNPHSGAKWSWDGNITIPTFSPSMNIQLRRGNDIVGVCHYTLINGIIEFKGDCTHALKGIKMSLSALPDYLRDR